jgi:uncharacterized membrane protein YedE/YeeE
MINLMIESKNTEISTKYKNIKPKKSQIPSGIIVLLLILIIGLFLSTISPKLGLYWITGISFGFILQKSRFCFVASMRDPYLTGNTSLTKAVLIAFAITTIGFTAIKYSAYINNLSIPGQSYIAPISLATAIGSFMFGIGMVIAGGCATGTLTRVGEGFLLQVIVLFAFIVGSLWGAYNFRWWEYNFIIKGKAIFLPDVFGWFGAVTLQLLFIGLLYTIVNKWEDYKLK